MLEFLKGEKKYTEVIDNSSDTTETMFSCTMGYNTTTGRIKTITIASE